MTRTIAIFLTLVAGTAFAFPDQALSPEKMEQIKATLTEQRFEVRKIEMEDGEIEVYAIKDGARLELYLDDELNILRTKIDD